MSFDNSTEASLSYLTKHKILKLFENLLESIIVQKPDDPYEHLITILRSLQLKNKDVNPTLVVTNSEPEIAPYRPDLSSSALSSHYNASFRQRRNSLDIINDLKKHNIKETSSITIDKSGQHERINQYLIKNIIGKGSYGTVKMAVDTITGETYAVKVLNKSILKRKRVIKPGEIHDALQDVLGEIALMKKLHHENIVSLYEVLDDPNEDTLVLVLELCSQGSVMVLEEEKAIKNIDSHLSWVYFRDMIKGLDYLHTQHVIHRDIKPENLLISEGNVLKIADFGQSQMFEGNDAQLNKTAGSPGFYAPEICTFEKGDQPYYGKPIDIWACGVVLYCFTFGKVPFWGKNLVEIFQNIRIKELHFPHEIDNMLRDLLVKMLCKNPNERITMEKIKRHPWVTKLGEFPMTDDPVQVQVFEREHRSTVNPIRN